MKPGRFLLIPLSCCIAMNQSLAAGPAPATETASHVRLEREHSFVAALPPPAAFPLFEPAGEKNWAEGWHPVFVSPEDARLHDGSVFTVESPHPHGGTTSSVWTISRYDPPRLIEYRNVLIGLRATRITVRCEPAEAGTRVTVRYVYNGLSDQGDHLLSQQTPEAYRAMIDDWGTAIADFLKRGTPASP